MFGRMAWRCLSSQMTIPRPPLAQAISAWGGRPTATRSVAVAAGKAGKQDYVCVECGHTSLQHFGQCRECKQYGTCKEVARIERMGGSTLSSGKSGGGAGMQATKRQKGWLEGGQKIESLKALRAKQKHLSATIPMHGPTGREIARVLGGGVRAGSLVLIGGDPGVGKSTLLLQLACLMGERSIAPDGGEAIESRPVLYVTGEESEDQVADRADRLEVSPDTNVDILRENDMDIIVQRIHEHRPCAVILDSIQTVYLNDASGSLGSVSQVKECTTVLVPLCKKSLIPIFVVGHVTKGGDIAGPKTLEHIVDTVLYLEGEEQSRCRILRATKNRFGSTDEVGIFEMTRTGLIPVADPGKFLERRQHGGEGAACATAVILEGNRPLFVEIQALCSEVHKDNPPRRMVNAGLDWKRFDQIIAVLIKHGRLELWKQDARLNVVGGIAVKDPAADAAIAAAVVSSYNSRPLPPDMAFVGELRVVTMLEKRVSDAVSLGFSKVVVPRGSLQGMAKKLHPHVIEIGSVRDLIQMLTK